jgi:hypothetical protein
MHAPARYRSKVSEAKDDAPVDSDLESDPAAGSDQDDARRKFREALERKNANPGRHPGSQTEVGSHLKSSNGKRQRQFRRKSG